MKAKIKGHEQFLEVVAYSSKTFSEKGLVGSKDVVKPVIILKTRDKANAQLIVVDIDEVESVD